MAECCDNGETPASSSSGCSNTYGSWLGGWIQTVKETSASAVELVKKDLSEFSQTMQCDTSRTAARIKDKITDDDTPSSGGKLKAGISTLLGGISKMLMVEPYSDDEGEEVLISKSGPVFNRAKARLHALQVDSSTYCDEMEDLPDFHRWLEEFDIDAHKGEISELLVNNTDVRAIYTKVVPSEVAHSLFWQRYYYRLHQLSQDEERREHLKMRAETSVHQDIGWGDDWIDLAGPPSPSKHSHISRGPHRSRQTSFNQSDAGTLQEPEVVIMSHDDVQEQSLPMHFFDYENSEFSAELRCVTTTYDVGRIAEVALQEGFTNMSPDGVVVLDCEAAVPCDQTNDANKNSHDNTGDGDAADKSISAEVNEAADESISAKVNEDAESPASRDTDVNGTYSLGIIEPMKGEETTVVDDVTVSCDDALASGTGIEGERVEEMTLKTRERGDMVVVGGRNGTTPTDSTDGSKDSTASLDDDWDAFDADLTEEDLKVAHDMAVSLGPAGLEGSLQEEDWENWE